MIVESSSGTVRGLLRQGCATFLGVPYAAPPVGDQRFAPPEPFASARGVLDATRPGPRPPQPVMPTPLGTPPPVGGTSEDCLRLNVFTPGTVGARPVMVWLHGGGLAFGSANDYDGTNLAMRNDVVVVAVGYRLGLLGYADLSPCGPEHAGSASNGFRDQIAALRWIRENIERFGGDPDRVTLFGQSGGGLSVLALLGAPEAEGLFHRAIVLSAGPPQPSPPAVVPILAGTLGVDITDLPQALRTLSVERLLEIQTGIGFTAGGSVDGTVVTRSPIEAILARGADGVPVIAGSTRDEGTLLSAMMGDLRGEVLELIAEGLAAGTFDGADPSEYLRRLRAELGDPDPLRLHTEVWTDHFRRTAVRVAEAACEAGPGGWLYRFDVEPRTELGDQLGVTHAADLGFVFDSLEHAPEPLLYNTQDPDVRRIAELWSQTLAAFAHDGDPQRHHPWPRYLPDRTCLVIQEDLHFAHDLDVGRQRTWNGA